MNKKGESMKYKLHERLLVKATGQIGRVMAINIDAKSYCLRELRELVFDSRLFIGEAQLRCPTDEELYQFSKR